MSRSAAYYAALIPTWMLINYLLNRATRAARRGIVALCTTSRQRQERAIRAWLQKA